MELFQASQQWAKRPDDQRFATLEEMYAQTKAYADQACETTVPFKDLRVEAVKGEVQLVGKTGTTAHASNFAFRQLAARAGAPANYLQTLPATLAAQNLNHGLAKRGADSTSNDAKLMFHQNGGLLLRSVTTEIYERIWNYEIVARLFGLQELGWQVPPARPCRADQAGTRIATEADVLRGASFNLSVKVGDPIAPAGLYASDKDMFAFMVYNDNRIDDGTPEGLARGVMVWQSEVGDCGINRLTFLYRQVCGNHICWDAKSVTKTSVAHVGDIRKKFGNVVVELKRYANESVSDIEATIKLARSKVIAASKDEVLDYLFKLRIPALSRKNLGAAYDLAEENSDTDGAPNTVWGMVQGITRHSQESPFADERTQLDKASAKVMQIVF